MTDSRLPGRWLTDVRFEQLSDRAWRTFCGSLMWSNVQGTDGRVPDVAMKFLHPLGVDDESRAELVSAGLWRIAKDGITIPDWSTKMGQSTAASVTAKREGNKERQRAYRARKTVAGNESVSRDVTRDAVGQDRIGQDRSEVPGHELDSNTGEIVDWGTAVPGEPDAAWVYSDSPGMVTGALRGG